MKLPVKTSSQTHNDAFTCKLIASLRLKESRSGTTRPVARPPASARPKAPVWRLAHATLLPLNEATCSRGARSRRGGVSSSNRCCQEMAEEPNERNPRRARRWVATNKSGYSRQLPPVRPRNSRFSEFHMKFFQPPSLSLFPDMLTPRYRPPPFYSLGVDRTGRLRRRC